MSVKLISYSQPSDEILEAGVNDMKDLVAYCARVSNPSNQNNTSNSEKLINYLIRNKHWSPLETVNICLEINTTRDIARQILRHRSFSFQEFCVAKGTKIKCFSRNQNIDIDLPIEYLYTIFKNKEVNKFYIYIFDEINNKVSYTMIKEVFKTGIKECFELQIQSISDKDKIYTIECTDEHKFFTIDNQYKQCKELQIGDKISILVQQTFEYGYIIGKKNIALKETYDIEVDHTSHNYIANGILTHNSQRYADPLKDLSFSEPREARLQDMKNRQNSISVDNIELQNQWNIYQNKVIEASQEAYKWALENGIAKEQARVVLPEGLMMSRMYINGTLRSWFHYCELRHDNGTQKEHQDIAKECIKVIRSIYPSFLTEINVDE